MKWWWKGDRKSKSFKYLGYTFYKNGEASEHIGKKTKKKSEWSHSKDII